MPVMFIYSAIVAIAGLVAAFFGAQAYSKSKASDKK